MIPNLKTIAQQRRYRLTWDESRSAREQDPWLMQLACKHGHIYPQAPGTLGASVDAHPGIVRRLVALPYVRPYQMGDGGEANLLFPVDRLPEVARIMRVRSKRTMSDAQRAASAARWAAIREQKKCQI